jgi:hypothetical protein
MNPNSRFVEFEILYVGEDETDYKSLGLQEPKGNVRVDKAFIDVHEIVAITKSCEDGGEFTETNITLRSRDVFTINASYDRVVSYLEMQHGFKISQFNGKH